MCGQTEALPAVPIFVAKTRRHAAVQCSQKFSDKFRKRPQVHPTSPRPERDQPRGLDGIRRITFLRGDWKNSIGSASNAR